MVTEVVEMEAAEMEAVVADMVTVMVDKVAVAAKLEQQNFFLQ